MKSTLALLFALIGAGSLLAQVPEAFSYQAMARAADGSVIADQSISVEIQILRDSLDGNAVFIETHSTTTSTSGMFTLRIGQGALQSGNFSEIAWGEHDHYMKVSLDLTGGSTYEEFGTSQLLSVPYAHYARTSSYDMGQEMRLDSLDQRVGAVESRNNEQDDKLEELLGLINLYHPFNCGDPLIDVRDGEVYGTVQVGSQCWMSEGLRYDVDGGGGSFSDGTGPTHIDTVGRYYNWAGAMDLDLLYNDSLFEPTGNTRGVCPIGWHVPTDTELNSMLSNSGFNGSGELVEGGSSGMEVKLGGRRSGGSYQNVGTLASLMSASESASNVRGDAQIFMVGATLFVADKSVASNLRCVLD